MTNKKGSLNLSIQAIVIVVIAFVVLGLGLGFVRNQFGSMEETASSVQEQIKQQIMDDLRTSNKKLSFPATSIDVERGNSKDIAVGIKNTNAQNDLNYKLEVTVMEDSEGKLSLDELADQVKFFYDKAPAVLSVTESRVHSVRINGVGITGTYLAKLRIIDMDDSSKAYDEKTFFITVY
jgi:hypothetical protein